MDFSPRLSAATHCSFSLGEKVPDRADEGAVVAGISPHPTLRTTLSPRERGRF